MCEVYLFTVVIPIPMHSHRLKYNPAHAWFYFPRMRRDEAIVFKVFDSETDGRARFTPHTSFVDRSTPAGASANSISTVPVMPWGGR